MEHHSLSPYPNPKDKSPLYVNEPWLVDKTILDIIPLKDTDGAEDNVRIYVPLDLNKAAILRRLDRIISQYGEASEDNEIEFSADVGMIISQIEIYDQICYVRHMPGDSKHSTEAVELVKEVVDRLEHIPDACSEVFPFDMIDELKREYL